MAMVLVRLVLRDLAVDPWTYLWIAYACSYGVFLHWWIDDDRGRDTVE